MKKHILLTTNLLISLLICFGFIGITWTNYQTYRIVMEDDIENISKLTSSNIYALIDNELTKPIFVAQTMANDSFLRDWLLEEGRNADNLAFKQQMKTYLHSYQVKYGYDAVFAISAKSNVYYYFDGVNKIVNPQNEHDDWYYTFLESGQPYTLNIDTDEANQNELTVFVDCRIEAPDGTLLGVTGVGVKMSRIQDLLLHYETTYDLEATLINDQGIVQVNTLLEDITAENLFEDPAMAELREKILGNRTSQEIHWYPAKQLDHCVITQYIENMDWYLVIRKNTAAIRQSFEQMIHQDMVVVSILLLLLLTVSTLTIRKFNHSIRIALNTDALTGLPNRKEFERLYPRFSKSSQYLFFFDIDRFKLINDTKGHLYGNQVLATVAQLSKDTIGNDGILARWGGDEFVGILKLPLPQVQARLQQLQERLAAQGQALEVTISISVGVVPLKNNLMLDELMELADQQLYATKNKGGDGVSICS